MRESDWETETPMTFNKRLVNIVGFQYGEKPEEKLDEIVQLKGLYCEEISKPLKIKSDDVGLEIGCGIGLVTNALAPKCQRLYSTDLNFDNLTDAKKYFNFNNVSYHHTTTPLNFDFIAEKLDFIYAHAIFIHFSLPMLYTHFETLQSVVKPGTRLYFDFANTNLLNFREDTLFTEVAGLVKSTGRNKDTFIQFNSESDVIRMAERFGFEVYHRKDLPQGITDLYLEYQ